VREARRYEQKAGEIKDGNWDIKRERIAILLAFSLSRSLFLTSGGMSLHDVGVVAVGLMGIHLKTRVLINIDANG
jgi:hypothetical protein